MSTSAVNALAAGTSGASATRTPASDAASADRFLKLLVAQMQNQDPLNPLDNAQVTSQMAQINTVAGIEKLNGTVQSLQAQFGQLQTLQGASLVGRDVTVPGDRFAVPASGGAPQAGFDLAGPADAVTVEVLNKAGLVVDRVELGAQTDGRHGIAWDGLPAGASAADYRFRISARSGTTQVAATPLMLDRVRAVAQDNGALVLDLERSGRIAYGDVRAFN